MSSSQFFVPQRVVSITDMVRVTSKKEAESRGNQSVEVNLDTKEAKSSLDRITEHLRVTETWHWNKTKQVYWLKGGDKNHCESIKAYLASMNILTTMHESVSEGFILTLDKNSMKFKKNVELQPVANTTSDTTVDHAAIARPHLSTHQRK